MPRLIDLGRLLAPQPLRAATDPATGLTAGRLARRWRELAESPTVANPADGAGRP